ncbi:hypothetical protein OIU78_024028 [Salix suchowensis]|nr:hypothetical protein OIU78_024028 [Salix suchowensis]
MASLTMLSSNLRLCPLHCFPTRVSYGSAQLAPLRVNNSLRLSSCRNISGSSSLSPLKIFSVTSLTQRFQSLTVFAAKGYKRKTHKASAKRFRVTGTGKIVRRRAGKQHLLAKKNTKRKLRLSKMIIDFGVLICALGLGSSFLEVQVLKILEKMCYPGSFDFLNLLSLSSVQIPWLMWI